MERPEVLVRDSFQQAWKDAVSLLIQSGGEWRNLVVQICKPDHYDDGFHAACDNFSAQQGLLGPKHVAYTIFPRRLASRHRDITKLSYEYNRPRGFYDRVARRAHRWGTYFQRMTAYPNPGGGVVNQLERIIGAIKSRRAVHKAAYTIVIPRPGAETAQPLGAPCLNYVAVQLEAGDPKHLGLLAVYRNHDFLERAYGNYWGLCNLLLYLAQETGAAPGPLTCVSSHAYIPNHRRALGELIRSLP